MRAAACSENVLKLRVACGLLWKCGRLFNYMKYGIWMLALVIAAPMFANEKQATEQRLMSATDVLHSIVDSNGGVIPKDLLNKASCVAVVPGLKKGGFIVAARYGTGYVSCRKPDGVGWTAPGTVTVEGGSFGFQIGAAEDDVVMLIMNKSGMRHLLSSQFTLGGDATVAAGPIGRSLGANTSAFMSAEIITYSRAHGVFAGVALEGATLRQNEKDNVALYGKPVSNRQILNGHVKTPAEAEPLIRELDRLSDRKTS